MAKEGDDNSGNVNFWISFHGSLSAHYLHAPYSKFDPEKEFSFPINTEVNNQTLVFQ
jgi:hypothetical protein